MEGLGAAASAVAIIDLSFKVISLCMRYAKDVKNAKNDIDELHEEVKELQRVVENVKKLLDSQPGSRLKTSRDLDQTLQSSFGLLSQLEKTLQPSSTSKAMTRMGIRALKWPFQKSELDPIIQRVRQCSHRVGLALQLDQTAILLDVDSKTDKVVNTVESMDQRRVLDTLPIATGAWYNSHAEEHNSICLENTRVELLQEIDSWVNSHLAQTIFWLSGMAGTGKSTISRTVATISAKRNILGASFLFKRGESDRGNISRFYTTVASQLVRFKPDLAPHMKAAIDDDPSLTGKVAGQQFDKLILQPLLSSQICKKGTLVLVVDALDECDGEGDIRRLIDLFARFSQVKGLKIRVLITSRPELPIRLGFSGIHGSYESLILHEIPETIIEHDLTVFFKERLTEIRRSYNTSVSEERRLSETWPDLNDYEILVQMSVPLFIFAATVCRFLSDRKCGSPNQQLQKVLEYKSRSQESKLEATYLPPLEQQLTGLSVREQGGVLEEFRHIVGTIVILEKPLSASALAQLLDISRDTIDVRLDMLHSVLDIPKHSNSPIRLLHLSFRDFLLDPEKIGTNRFWVDEKQAHGQTAVNCLRVMDKCLREDICDLIAPGTDTSAVLPSQIASCIPLELQYACCHWAYHLQHSERDFCSDEQVLNFLTRHFLHWLEVLSLIRRSAEGFQIVKLLRALMQPVWKA
ncbi:hypothetical protein BKA56DRAFT_679629 [Ilyonectria sp. MPI-CAGE-AT-0026]|nr:hypothetical protein BKA56DRAFT_679629 [Ilyonectria sp. MPI-CAGE-AT-0026]